jgi:MFS family permease
MRALLRHRDMRVLFIGLATTMLGDWLMLLVFAIWVKTLTGSNGAAALVSLFIVLPCAAAPLGGWLVDRVRRRTFLIATNVASALMLLPLLAVHDRQDVWIIYLVSALYGISIVAGSSALNGLLKELLAEEMLATANGALRTVKEGMRLVGPLAGAALFTTLGGAAVAAVDAMTFLAAAAAIALLRLREPPPERTSLELRQEMVAGLRHLATEPALRRMMTGAGTAWLFIGLTESVAFAVVDQGLHRPPEFIGVLASAQGAGCIVAGLCAAWLINRLGELAVTALGMAAFGMACGLLIASSLPTVFAGRAMGGAGLTLAMVGFETLLQRRTPQALMGRVSTAAETLTSGPQTASIAVGAVLVSLVDYRLLLAVIFAGALTAAIYLWAGRRLAAPTVHGGHRELPQPRDRPPAGHAAARPATRGG